MLRASRFVLNINYRQLSINYFINFFSLIISLISFVIYSFMFILVLYKFNQYWRSSSFNFSMAYLNVVRDIAA